MRGVLILLTAFAFMVGAAAVSNIVGSYGPIDSRDVAAACEPPAAPYVPVAGGLWKAAHPGDFGPIVCAPHNSKQPSLRAWVIALGE